MHQMPARKKELERMGRILTGRGFGLVDSISAFAFKQVAGMVKDQLHTWIRYVRIQAVDTRGRWS